MAVREFHLERAVLCHAVFPQDLISVTVKDVIFPTEFIDVRERENGVRLTMPHIVSE